MKTLAIGTLAAVGSCCLTAAAASADPGWPRVFKQDNRQLTVYQPQIDYWHGYTNVHFRCAIAVKGVLKQEKFGVAEVDAVTLADQVDRIVAMVPTQRRHLGVCAVGKSYVALCRHHRHNPLALVGDCHRVHFRDAKLLLLQNAFDCYGTAKMDVGVTIPVIHLRLIDCELPVVLLEHTRPTRIGGLRHCR